MKTNEPPKSLSAKTKELLRLRMIAVNKGHNKKFHFFDFTFAQGEWHCWYEIGVKEDLTNGS